MFYLFKNTSGEIRNRVDAAGVKKNVAELEDSSRNYPKQRNTREKEEGPPGPSTPSGTMAFVRRDLGPGESGETAVPQPLLSPHGAPRELQGPRALLVTSALMRRHLEPWEVWEALLQPSNWPVAFRGRRKPTKQDPPGQTPALPVTQTPQGTPHLLLTSPLGQKLQEGDSIQAGKGVKKHSSSAGQGLRGRPSDRIDQNVK